MQGLAVRGPHQRRERIQSNATQFAEAKKEIEDASRRAQALQDYRQRQDSPHALRQTPFARHQGGQAHAQAEKACAGAQDRCGRCAADVALRGVSFVMARRATHKEIAKLTFRNYVPGSATRVPAGRLIPHCGVVALVFKTSADRCRVRQINESYWKQTRCAKRFTLFRRNPFCFPER